MDEKEIKRLEQEYQKDKLIIELMVYEGMKKEEAEHVANFFFRHPPTES